MLLLPEIHNSKMMKIISLCAKKESPTYTSLSLSHQHLSQFYAKFFCKNFVGSGACGGRAVHRHCVYVFVRIWWLGWFQDWVSFSIFHVLIISVFGFSFGSSKLSRSKIWKVKSPPRFFRLEIPQELLASMKNTILLQARKFAQTIISQKYIRNPRNRSDNFRISKYSNAKLTRLSKNVPIVYWVQKSSTYFNLVLLQREEEVTT